MTYETYSYIFLGCAILAGVMFALTVFLFFFLNIPDVIGNLTGANARKAIKNISTRNENNKSASYITGRVDREMGRITDEIASKKLSGNTKSPIYKKAIANGIDTVVLNDSYASNETTLLCDETDNEFKTTVLSGNGQNTATSSARQSLSNPFFVEYEITFIHTDERIV